MPPKAQRSNIKTTGRLIAAAVLILMLTMVGWTGWFLYDILNPDVAVDGAATTAPDAETLNTELLDKIEKNLTAKMTRPIPKPEDLRNPFLIPPEPTVEPEPAPETPIPEPAPEQPTPPVP